MKKIVILKSIEEYQFFLQKQGKEYPNFLLIANEMKLRYFLEKNGISFNIPENYLNIKECKLFDISALKLSANWHDNLFEFQGYSLGKMISWDITYYFAKIFESIQYLENMIKIENPDEIIFFSNKFDEFIEYPKLIRYIGDYYHIKTKNFEFSNKQKKNGVISSNFFSKIISQINKIPSNFLFSWFFKLISRFSNNKYKKYANPEKKKILVKGSNYFPQLLKELKKANKIYNFLVQPFLNDIIINISSLFKNEQTQNVFFHYMTNKKCKYKAKKYVEENRKQWIANLDKINKEKKFIFKNYNIWKIIDENFENRIMNHFKQTIIRLIAIEIFLKDENFDLIVLSVDTFEIDKIIASVAKKLGIPSIVVQHGITGDEIDVGFAPLTADLFAAWGKNAQKCLIKSGVPQERIKITGAPKFDNYLNDNFTDERLEQRTKVRKDFRIPKEKKIILFTSSHINFKNRLSSAHLQINEVINIYKCLFEVIKMNSDYHFIIKLHIGDDNPQLVKKMIEDYHVNNCSLTLSYDILPLIFSSDCIITPFSTTGLEGIVLKIPIVCINFRDYDYHVSYRKNKIANDTSDPIELSDQLHSLIENPNQIMVNRDEYLENEIYKLDNLASARISQLISDMIEKSKM
jgi:UDP-N-acetylglucosamine 2-epimerase